MTAAIPEARVSATWRGDVRQPYWELEFVDECPHDCGKRHRHGGGNDPAGPSYGHWTDHCEWHTHARNDRGNRQRVNAENVCPIMHSGYVLVPA